MNKLNLTTSFIVSWSGLLYLALFFCSKFAISVPFLPPRPFSQDPSPMAVESLSETDRNILPLHHHHHEASESNDEEPMDPITYTAKSSNSLVVPIRNQAAAPPNYLLVLPLVPICTAIYICSTRYFQFFHYGFDIIFGSLIGILSAWFAFRWYHLPISQGAGWSWGARSRDRAWAVGVGVGGYVGTEGWASKRSGTKASVNGSQQPVLGPGLDSEREAVLATREVNQAV